MRYLILTALATIFSYSASVHAEPIRSLSVKGNLQPSTSNYYSGMNGQFVVSYANHSIPWGSRVFLRHGFLRSEFSQGELMPVSSWNDQRILEMTASGPFTWQVATAAQLYSRGSSWQYTAIDFVLEIHLSNGEVNFDKGSDSVLGYFEAVAPRYDDVCNQVNSTAGCELQIKEVIQN